MGPQSGIIFQIVTTRPPVLSYKFVTSISQQPLIRSTSDFDQRLRGHKVIERQPPLEYNLHWKMTSIGRRPPLEDDLHWKTTAIGRRPPLEDDLHWKMTSIGRRPPMEEILIV